MKIAFYGARPAGVILLTSLRALGYTVTHVFAEDLEVELTAKTFALPLYNYKTLNSKKTITELKEKVDLFICCHGWTILSGEFVSQIRCINFHPCLYHYKGLHPIQRLIHDNNPKASVATHFMTEKIDEGKIIYEEFRIIQDITKKTEADVYSELYPLYISVLKETLFRIQMKSHLSEK